MKKIIFILLITLVSCTPDNSKAPEFNNYFSIERDYYPVKQSFWRDDIKSIIATNNTDSNVVLIISFKEKPKETKRYYTKTPGEIINNDECSFTIIQNQVISYSTYQKKDEVYFESIIDVKKQDNNQYLIDFGNVTMMKNNQKVVSNGNFKLKL